MNGASLSCGSPLRSGPEKTKKSAEALLLVGRPNYLHSDGAKRAGRLPAAPPTKPEADAPAARQRHATACAGGVKAAVPTGSAVATGALGVTISVPPPAAAVVVMVMTPVADAMVIDATLRVPVGPV